MATAKPNRSGPITHGDSGSPEHRSWIKMLSRCYNPNCARFERWGGRGIVVCDRWRTSYQNFLDDMGRKPTTEHSLERRNNDGNYELSNCYWATRSEQMRNTRHNINLTFNGRTQCLSAWATETGIPFSTLRRRIVEYQWPHGKALTIPARCQ